MISMLMFLMSLATQRHIEHRPENDVHHAVMSVAALADGMAYYQAQAMQHCWHSDGMACAAGTIPLRSRNGSQTEISYGTGYETVTDGSTYIVTTLATKGNVAGRSTKESNINSGVFAALKSMSEDSTTVGYYDVTASGVIIPEKDNAIIPVTFSSTPVQGQPVLYSSVVTAPPPAQVASLDGGNYSPLVPIPPSVTPAPVSPAAVVSPPASVSPSVPTSPIYTPPATVVVNPISPWAPSPVPPPPPPPPPPVPPPPPPAPPIPSTITQVAAVFWGPVVFAHVGHAPWLPSGRGQIIDSISTMMQIRLETANGGKLYSIGCYIGDSTSNPLSSVRPPSSIDLGQARRVAEIDVMGTAEQCNAATKLITLLNETQNTWWAFDLYTNDTYVIQDTIHMYGMSALGLIGRSLNAFSGNVYPYTVVARSKLPDPYRDGPLSVYYPYTRLTSDYDDGGRGLYFDDYGLYSYGDTIIQPLDDELTKPTPGLNYSQSVLVDQYVTILSNGIY